MIPNLPEVPADQGKGPFLVIASMVGTTVFSGLFIIRTTLVKEAGWALGDLKKQRNDAIVSVSLMFVISSAIMASAAGTMFKEGLGLSHASQMITLLEPLAGKLATGIFAFGIISAGVSSQFPNVLMLPWLLCDYNQFERGGYVLIDVTKIPCFSVNRMYVKDRYVKESKTFYMGIVSKGSGTIVIGKQSYEVEEGSKFFISYQAGSVIFESDSNMEIIATFPPEI